MQILTPKLQNHSQKSNTNLNDIFSKEIYSLPTEKWPDILEQWKIEAEKGIVEFQYYVGKCYEEGIGVKPSYSTAFEYYKKAADQGNDYAQIQVADFYENGKGTPKNPLKAFRYYELAAKQSNSWALASLGHCYEKGIGTPVFHRKAVKYYKLSVKKENPLGYYYLAEAYKKGLGIKMSLIEAYFLEDKIRSYYDKKADKGFPEAQVQMGLMYENGLENEKFETLAFKYYQKAAEQNYPQGQYHLGRCFENNIGVKSSLNAAVKYYKLAANQNYIPASYNLVKYYFLHDEELAFSYVNHCLNQNLYPKIRSHCLYLLGVHFENYLNRHPNSTIGYSRITHYKEAIEYYEKAANENDSRAQNRLARAYYNGELGFTKSLEKAIHYYFLAAQQGNEKAIKQLIGFFEKGILVEQSVDQTFSLYKILADHHVPNAYYPLANYYEFGFGTKISLEDAITYYIRSGEGNYHPEGYFRAACCFMKKRDKDSRLQAVHFFHIAGDVILKPIQISPIKLMPYQFTETIDTGFVLDKSLILMQFYYQKLEEEGENKAVILKDQKNTFESLKKAADEGNALAQSFLFSCYISGILTEKSASEAFKYCQLAAEDDFAIGLYNLGVFYEQGIIVEKSLDKASEFFIRAAKKFFAPALYKQAFYIDNGIISRILEGPPDKFYKAAAEKGLREAQYQMGEYLRKLNPKEGRLYFDYYYASAEQGYGPAYYHVGNCYFRGLGRIQSFEGAREYYTKGMEAGDPKATYMLGLLSEYASERNSESLERAIHFYYLADSNNYKDAAYELARYYHYGLGVKRSLEKSRFYYENSALQGDPRSFFLLHKESWVTSFNSFKKSLITKRIFDSADAKIQNLNALFLQIGVMFLRNSFRAGMPDDVIIYPNAQSLNIEPYLKDRNLKTLEAILDEHSEEPITLEMLLPVKEEVMVISRALIKNDRLTFICPEHLSKQVLKLFNPRHYKTKCLKIRKLDKNLIGIIFIHKINESRLITAN